MDEERAQTTLYMSTYSSYITQLKDDKGLYPILWSLFPVYTFCSTNGANKSLKNVWKLKYLGGTQTYKSRPEKCSGICCHYSVVRGFRIKAQLVMTANDDPCGTGSFWGADGRSDAQKTPCILSCLQQFANKPCTVPDESSTHTHAFKFNFSIYSFYF